MELRWSSWPEINCRKDESIEHFTQEESGNAHVCLGNRKEGTDGRDAGQSSMNYEASLRVVLIVVTHLVLPTGVYYRLKSQATREKLDRSQEGLFIWATLRPVGIALWLETIVWTIDPVRIAWSSVPLPAWLRWTGVGVLALACGCWLVWTFRCLGPNLTDTVVTRQKHTLITDGPHRWIRHPFYDSAALLAVAVSLIAANWLVLVTGVAL